MDGDARGKWPGLDKLLPGVIALRRDLHAHPEVGFQELRTAQQVAAWLEQLPGVTLRKGVAGTGIVATLAAEKQGPCIALRADMDALPMEDACAMPHVSRHPGRAHACGHDGHTAMLLGAATLLAASPERLTGPVRFIFQPAEEEGGGARCMVEEGALEEPRVAAIFALHAWPALPLGSIGLRSGPIMAATDAIDITVLGQGGHASTPHHTIDPIVAASQIVIALQTVVARCNDPAKPAVLTIGRFQAGTARNVIPEKAVLQGTLRTLCEEQRQKLRHAIKEVSQHVAAALGARVELQLEEGYPVNSNDPLLAEYVRSVTGAALGSAQVLEEQPISMVGEDFAYYLHRVPGFFIRLGMTPPGEESSAPALHNPAFDFNDDALATGIKVLCALARGDLARFMPQIER